MNLLQLLGMIRKAGDALDLAGSATDELSLFGRALGNALATTGFPVPDAYAIWTQVGPGDPLKLVQALRGNQNIRVWVGSWSGALGSVGPPGGPAAPAAGARKGPRSAPLRRVR